MVVALLKMLKVGNKVESAEPRRPIRQVDVGLRHVVPLDPRGQVHIVAQLSVFAFEKEVTTVGTSIGLFRPIAPTDEPRRTRAPNGQILGGGDAVDPFQIASRRERSG